MNFFLLSRLETLTQSYKMLFEILTSNAGTLIYSFCLYMNDNLSKKKKTKKKTGVEENCVHFQGGMLSWCSQL